MTARLPRAQGRFQVSLAVGLLLVVAAAAGCGSSGAYSTAAAPSASLTAGATTGQPAVPSSGQPAADSEGACSLVTASAVTTAMGEPMTQLAGEASDCIYAAASDHSQQLLVHYLDPVNTANLRQQIESSSEHVDGIGDDAFWNGTADLMFVRRGQRAFTLISVALGAKTPTNPDAPKAAMVALASSAKSGF